MIPEDYVWGLRFAGEVAAKYPHALYSVIGHLGQSSAHCGAKGCFRACLAHLEQKGKRLNYPEKYIGQNHPAGGLHPARQSGQRGDQRVNQKKFYRKVLAFLKFAVYVILAGNGKILK